MPKKQTLTPSLADEPPSKQKNPKRITKKLSSYLTKWSQKLLSYLGIISPETKEPFYQTIKQLKISSKTMSVEEKDLLHNFLSFSNKTVSDVMIPRSSICALDDSLSTEEIYNFIDKHAHTRTFVYTGTLDNIKGFIHIKDLFALLITKQPFVLKKLLRKPLIVAPSMKLIDLLAEMQRARTHTAIVIDEYGGTDGMVTIEDIMEEIVGRIEDEHDQEDEFKYKALKDNTLLVNARIEVEEIEELLGIKLKNSEDEFDTVGGMVLSVVGHMPSIGDVISLSERITAEIVETTPRSIKLVKLTISPKLV